MPTYLVESYQPKGGSSLAATVAALVGSRSGAQHRWSLLLPDEDICLHVLDAQSADAVREVTVSAELRCQRISEAVLISAEHLDLEAGSP